MKSFFVRLTSLTVLFSLVLFVPVPTQTNHPLNQLLALSPNSPFIPETITLQAKEGQITGAEIVVQMLQAYGLNTIWGLPGDVTEFQKAVHETDGAIEFIPVRHEQQGGFSAQGFAIGKTLLGDNTQPGVVYASLGPGATNIPTPVANAFQDNTPMIVLVDQLPKGQTVTRYHQYIDLKELFGGDSAYERGISKKVYQVEDARYLPDIMAQAYSLAIAEQPGPVVVILREDILQQKIPFEQLTSPAAKPKPPTQKSDIPAQIQQLHEELASSKFTVAILGPALVRQQAGKEVQQFLQRHNIPFFTTLMAKGIVPETNPLSLGPINRHLLSAYKDLFEKADTVLTIGFDIVEGVKPSVWEATGKKRVIHVDEVASTLPQVFNPDREFVVPLKLFFQEENKTAAPEEQTIPISLDHLRENIRDRFIANSDKTRYIARILEALRQSLPEDVVLISDVGNHKQLVGLFFTALSPAVTFNGLSAIGAALPVSIGIQKAMPNATVVAVHGDGGFLLNSPAMQTARDQNLPVIVVLFDDNAYGMIKTKQMRSFGGTVAVDLSNPDFNQLAQAYGWDYWTPKEPGEAGIRALEQFLFSLTDNSSATALMHRENPLLIHIPVEYEHKKAKESDIALGEEDKKIRALVRYLVEEYAKRPELRKSGRVKNETEDDLEELRLLIKENLRLDGKTSMAEIFDVSQFPFIGRMGKYPSIQSVRTEMVLLYLLEYFNIDFLTNQIYNDSIVVRWPNNGPVFDWVSLIYRIGEFPTILTYMKAKFLKEVLQHTDPLVLQKLIQKAETNPNLLLEFMVYAWCRCQGGEWLFNFARRHASQVLPSAGLKNQIETSV